MHSDDCLKAGTQVVVSDTSAALTAKQSSQTSTPRQSVRLKRKMSVTADESARRRLGDTAGTKHVQPVSSTSATVSRTVEAKDGHEEMHSKCTRIALVSAAPVTCDSPSRLMRIASQLSGLDESAGPPSTELRAKPTLKPMPRDSKTQIKVTEPRKALENGCEQLTPHEREMLAEQGLRSRSDLLQATITDDNWLGLCVDTLFTNDKGFSPHRRTLIKLRLSVEDDNNTAFCDAMSAMQDTVLVKLYESGLTSIKAMQAANLLSEPEIRVFVGAALRDFNEIQRIVAVARLKNAVSLA